jgi:hypothetical protein
VNSLELRSGKADRLIQPVAEQQAVRQAGEAVVMRNSLDAFLGQLVFRDVGCHRKPAQDFILVPRHAAAACLRYGGTRRFGAVTIRW